MMDGGVRASRDEGTPQGGPRSPLLAKEFAEPRYRSKPNRRAAAEPPAGANLIGPRAGFAGTRQDRQWAVGVCENQEGRTTGELFVVVPARLTGAPTLLRSVLQGPS